MRILQITDLHIGEVYEDTFGVDVRKNFDTILEKAQQSAPDHIVITGDLCFQSGDMEIYNWIHDRLESIQIPYSVIAGNHDDYKMLADVFGLRHLMEGEDLFYKLKLNGQDLLYLDTSTNYLSKTQLDWLRSKLSRASHRIIVFMHHPPAHVGVPFMDENYPLNNYQEVQDVLLQSDREIHVFCGHYHVEKTIQVGKLSVHITPSTFFQLDQNSVEFKVDHHDIAYRELECGPTEFKTKVTYCKGNQLKKVV